MPQSTYPSADIVIVGGGIVGLTIARALAISFSEELELLAIPSDLEPAEKAAADTGRRKYEDEAWTWRR